MIKEGVMPMPTKLGSRTSVWPEDEIQSAIDAVVAGRFANIRDLVKGVQP
jgi:predicted DNA-binding transcriptional regulator AlpA